MWEVQKKGVYHRRYPEMALTAHGMDDKPPFG